MESSRRWSLMSVVNGRLAKEPAGEGLNGGVLNRVKRR